MRMSPARAHFLRKTAESESATPNRENLEGLQGYDLVLAQLKAHQRQLKKIQSIERKIEFKRNNFEQYRPWVEGPCQRLRCARHGYHHNADLVD